MKLLIKILLWITTVIVGLLTALVILNIIPWTPKLKGENLWKQDGLPLVIPHGGAKSLYPENTKRAFDETSIYDVFEIDLALTKDGYLISHHDLDMKYTTGEDLLVADHTLEEVVNIFRDTDYYLARNFKERDGSQPYRNLPASELEDFVPVTLTYMFETYPQHLYILEIKDTSEFSGEENFQKAANRLFELIENYEMHEQVIVASFDDDVVSYYRKIDNLSPTASGWSESLMFVVFSAFDLDFFYQPKAHALILPNNEQKVTGSEVKLLNMLPGMFRNRIVIDIDGTYHTNLMQGNLVNDAHRKNMAILYWTINDADEMRHLIELGVDGIITDLPDVLKQIIEEEYS